MVGNGVRRVLCSALVACSSPSGSFEFRMNGAPVLVATQSDDSGWTRLSASSSILGDEVYEIPRGDVADAITVVCEHSDGTYSATQVRTTADEIDATLLGWFPPRCDSSLSTATLTAQAHSEVAPTYVAVLDKSAVNFGYDFALSLPLPQRPVDLAFYDGNGALILRDLDLSKGPIDLGQIDLASGVALEEGTYSFDPVEGDETVTAYSEELTANGTGLEWSHNPGMFLQTATSGAVDGDSSWTVLSAAGGNTVRKAEYDVKDVPENFGWIPRISGVQFDPSVTEASVTPPVFNYTELRLECTATTSGLVRYEELLVSQHSAQASVEFDHDIPGWDASWTLGEAGRTCRLAFEQRQSAATFTSSAVVSQ
jgi:hypothetical protein